MLSSHIGKRWVTRSPYIVLGNPYFMSRLQNAFYYHGIRADPPLIRDLLDLRLTSYIVHAPDV